MVVRAVRRRGVDKTSGALGRCSTRVGMENAA